MPSAHMLAFFNLIATLPLALVALRMLRARRVAVAGTTLSHPWLWMIASLTIYCIAQLLALPQWGLPVGWQSRIGFFALTMLLSPFVSVLGARRPGARVWDCFIIVPMLLVLNWPALAASSRALAEEPVALESPATMGVFVVLVMMLGNYFGTVFTTRTLIWGLSILAGLSEFSELLPTLGDSHYVPRIVTSFGLMLALVRLPVYWSRVSAPRRGYEKVWLDFRDQFGILWAKRIMDRLNQTALQEKWSVTVSLDGLEWQPDVTDEEREFSLSRIDHALRWLLRRFADESWIDERLNKEETIDASEPPRP